MHKLMRTEHIEKIGSYFLTSTDFQQKGVRLCVSLDRITCMKHIPSGSIPE